MMNFYDLQAFGQYGRGGYASTLKNRDYKDATDLVTEKPLPPRRLMPIECCRLQGFPDWWTDGVKGSDAAQYKMWGNGVALPCVLYVMEGIADVLNRPD